MLSTFFSHEVRQLKPSSHFQIQDTRDASEDEKSINFLDHVYSIFAQTGFEDIKLERTRSDVHWYSIIVGRKAERIICEIKK